jgi:hypothetical protein
VWKYKQKSGQLTNSTGSGVCIGYSGHGEGLDNPAMQRVPDIGPIPTGKYSIGTFFDDAGGKGPIVAHLTPLAETDTFGRTGFMVHGDNSGGNHSASHGCIILPHLIREAIMASSDRTLEVLA